MVCMYIDIDIVCSACGSCCVGLCFGLVCRWFVPARVVLCCAMCALLSVVIWCTRVTIRCNRFSVLDGIVFYLVRYRAIVARFTSVYHVVG